MEVGAEQSKSRRSQDAGKGLSATIGEGGTERKDEPARPAVDERLEKR
jgi:hypothetical protein